MTTSASWPKWPRSAIYSWANLVLTEYRRKLFTGTQIVQLRINL
jgi:hypothetical protein